MLEKEKFNGKVLIFPLLEIELLKTDVNLKEAEVLVFTSVYALEKITLELKSLEKPVFAVGQRCEELLKEMQVFSAILLVVLILITLVGVNQYGDYAFVTFGFTLTWIVRSLAIKYFS